MPISAGAPNFKWHSKPEILTNFADPSWRKKVFLDFDTTILSRQKPFPCFYGVAGHKAGHLRFSFYETDPVACVAGDLITRFIPRQGSLEVQRDEPLKEHKWHAHETAETLIIWEGEMHFYYRDGKKNLSRVCSPGDIIHLPRGVVHGSKASEKGIIYLIVLAES